MVHPADELLQRTAAVPCQMPGAPMSGLDPVQSSDVTASAHVWPDMDDLEFLTDPDLWTYVNKGSVRLSARLADMCDSAKQARAINQLIESVTNKYGMGCAFDMTVTVPGSVLSFNKPVGDEPVGVTCVPGQCPVISAVYFSHTDSELMVVEGQVLAGSKLWTFREGEKPVEYLHLANKEVDAQDADMTPAGPSKALAGGSTVLQHLLLSVQGTPYCILYIAVTHAG